MKILSCLAFAVLLVPAPLLAGTAPPSCTKPAESAYVKMPRPPVQCKESGGPECDDPKLSAADRASCAAAGTTYAKLLQRKLRPDWWTLPAPEVEACREQKEGGSPDEGMGEVIQGSDRVRLLLLGGTCHEAAGIYNVMLAVKADQGLVVKALKLNYYEPRQEAPFGLQVVRNGADTLALVSVQGHDMHEAFTITSAYKVDLASGEVSAYPLFQTESGPSSTLESSEPTLNFEEDESSAPVRDGKLVERFVQYDYVKDCEEDSCAPDVASKKAYRWNGSAFAVDKSAAPKTAERSTLATHRACLKAKFDARTGTAECPGDFADNCESNNDLSFLNYKAGKLDRARDYAAKALEECKDDPKQLAAAQYNDRRARGDK